MRSARSKGKKNQEYLDFIHMLPCSICRGKQATPTQAHHAGVRGMGQKAADRTAIPLCDAHHNRMSPISIHSMGKRFWMHYGIDRDALIEALNKRFDSLKG